LRGRSGRQGDPGKSKFFLSLEDDLVRLFGGDRMKALMTRFKVDEDMPLEARMLSKSIESAQRRIEGHHFAVRKNVIQYDDVLNRQREVIYNQRNSVLDGSDVQDQIVGMMTQCAEKTVLKYLIDDSLKANWNLEGLKDYYIGWLIKPSDKKFSHENLNSLVIREIIDLIIDEGNKVYRKQESTFGEEAMRELERVLLLKNVDKQWMDHIDAMEELKRGIGLRGYAQRDPIVDYRVEGFDMFEEMIETIKQDTVKGILSFKITNIFDFDKPNNIIPIGGSDYTFDGKTKLGG
jgi:preprotein translocase subunit SecA